MVGSQGLEPRMPKAPDLQSGAVTCSARYPMIRGTPSVSQRVAVV